MFNLIRKDLFIQKTALMILLPILFIDLTFNNSTIWIGLIFSIALIMNAFSSDEKSSIHTLLNSLPYTRKEIVSSKYIGAFVFIFLVVSTLFLGKLIVHQDLILWKEVLLMVGLVLIIISFMFPFSYKFKSQYLFIGSLVLFGLYLLVVNIFNLNINDQIRAFVQKLLMLQATHFYLLVSLAVIFIYISSWLLSIRIYSRKVF